MPTIKEYKAKLKSLANTKKMTRTMKLVSASKLRQIHHKQINAKHYARELTGLIARLSASVDSTSHPLLFARYPVKKLLIVVISSDKGLCGGFNNNLIKKIFNWLKEMKGRYEHIEMICCGKRGWMAFRNHLAIKKNYEGLATKFDFMATRRMADDLREAFCSGNCDEVYIAFNRFNNPLSQVPAIEKILPIQSSELLDQGGATASDYILEPGQEELLQSLVQTFFYYKIYYTLLENSAGEHGARMTAMDKATQNATDLIAKYTLLRNRARQAAITKELIEIISGAEALKN